MAQSNELLALDVGEKRIGVARANTIARIPEPLEIIKVDGQEFIALGKLVDMYKPQQIVIGLPRNMSGQETAQSAWIRNWATDFKKNVELDGSHVCFWDETLSSVRAREQSRAKHIDDLAAGDILASFMEHN